MRADATRAANAIHAAAMHASHSHPVARKNALVAISACVSHGRVCRLCWYTDTTCGTTYTSSTAITPNAMTVTTAG